MTTLGRIYRTVTGMADYGRRLPATEQLAWRALAVQLQEFADQDQEFADQEPSRPTWSPPPEGVAEGVRALHGQLVTMNTPVSALVARWVSLWLAECADQTQRRAQRAQARATAQQDPARPELLVTRRGRWGTSASRRATYRPGLQRRRVWPVLLISGATVETAVEFQCLVAVRWVATLTCAADDRPWQWRQVGSQIQARIGPPPTLEPPSAAQIAEELEHLACGLNPGSWRVSTIPAGAR